MVTMAHLAATEGEDDRILVLGIGNLLWADEGFGVRCVEALYERYDLSGPLPVDLLDGGTQGLYLVQYVKEASHLLVFDAVDYGLEPGTLIEVDNDEVPKFTGIKKMSLHQTGFQEVLSAAQLMGGYPRQLKLIGVQAECLENWGGSLTDTVKSCLDPALARAVAVLREWGVTVRRRSTPLNGRQGLVGHGLDLRGYERDTTASSSPQREG